MVELPFAADCCPCVEKLRTVLPSTGGIRDGVVHLLPTLGSAVISARAEIGRIIASALPVATLLTSGGGPTSCRELAPLYAPDELTSKVADIGNYPAVRT